MRLLKDSFLLWILSVLGVGGRVEVDFAIGVFGRGHAAVTPCCFGLGPRRTAGGAGLGMMRSSSAVMGMRLAWLVIPQTLSSR